MDVSGQLRKLRSTLFEQGVYGLTAGSLHLASLVGATAQRLSRPNTPQQYDPSPESMPVNTTVAAVGEFATGVATAELDAS
jgi:hypothetical protein